MHTPAPVQTSDACTTSSIPTQKLSRLDPSAHGWLSTSEVAEALGISCRAVCKACQSGRITARKTAWCKGWLIPSSELDRLIEAEGVRRG